MPISRSAPYRILAGAAALTLLIAATRAAAPAPPRIRHVFVLMLENEDYDTTFGPGSRAPYLAHTLVRSGALLRNYFATGHNSLDNYISIISGLAPTPQTQADCPAFLEFMQTGTAPDGQPIGTGCIYPASVPTIANQLSAQHFSWKGYMEDMGKDSAREPATCGHVPIGATDITQRARPNDEYAAKHDPFVYFHAIIDSASCQANVVPLPGLESDLKDLKRTPNFAFIVPNLCHDGHDRPCHDSSGAPGGIATADRFLAHWVPLITNSRAFREDGLLVITFDEARGTDATACCNEPAGPNTKQPGTIGPGGGRVGAVLISRFIKAGTVSAVPYNHYSLLRSIEELFGLPYIGYAGQPGLASFGADVYTSAPKGQD